MVVQEELTTAPEAVRETHAVHKRVFEAEGLAGPRTGFVLGSGWGHFVGSGEVVAAGPDAADDDVIASALNGAG